MANNTERVTITIPRPLLVEIDRLERNRSRFVLEAVTRELDRRRREALQRSLATPHAEAAEIAETGFDDWADRLSIEDAEGLVDTSSGTRVRWNPGEGWRETSE